MNVLAILANCIEAFLMEFLADLVGSYTTPTQDIRMSRDGPKRRAEWPLLTTMQDR